MPGQVIRDRDGEFSFKVVHHLGVYGRSAKGWTKEVNVIEWNGKKAKLDLREWDPEHTRMSRGITLHKQEMLYLLQILLKNYGKELREIQRAREEWQPQPDEEIREEFSLPAAETAAFGTETEPDTDPPAAQMPETEQISPECEPAEELFSQETLTEEDAG